MNAPAAQAHPFLSTIAELYKDQGNLTYGEDITQIEHAVQCAELAVRAGESDELISAALLHDIGHLMAATDIAFGNYKHDSIGADYLSPYFSKAVTEPIRQHAQAKRYLCSVEEGYLASLSAASLDSLKNQGGLMTEEEQLAFAATPYFVESIRLRRWDDEGKNLELSKLSIEHYSHHLAAAIKPVETWSNPMHDEAEHFQKRGYIVLPQAFDNNELSNLENEVKTLNKHAQSLLNQLSDSNQSLDDFYQENLTELIVVPEQGDPQKVCRYEYINGFSTEIKHSLVPKLQKLIKQLTGTDFVLFKDKCNEKNPGGGAFDPHQDVIAYDHFNPKYHVTVAIFLDDATLENGCLYFPKDYLKDLAKLDTKRVVTKVGERPVLASNVGGPKHGAIEQSVSDQLQWQAIPARSGDLVIFDSYVPHYSDKNNSLNSRRAMFFTFNAAQDGDYYHAYYDMKHREFSNPNFHIATPTEHKL